MGKPEAARSLKLGHPAEILQGRASGVKTPEADVRLLSRLKPRPTNWGHFLAAC